MYTVIGVMPATFATPTINTEAWTPVHVSILSRQTSAEFIFCEVTVASRLASALNKHAQKCRLSITILRLNIQQTTKTAPQSCFLFMNVSSESHGARCMSCLRRSVFVLLIACANFANLLLARAAEREREFVIRGALGAGKWRLIRQSSTRACWLNSLVACLPLGSRTGERVCWLLSSLTPAAACRNRCRCSRAAAFTLGVSLLTGVIFGLLPAWDGCANWHWRITKRRRSKCDGGKRTATTTKYVRCR